MSYYTLAISGSSHDASICLMKDAEIVTAYSCERISRHKHTQSVLESDLSVLRRYTNLIDKIIVVNVQLGKGSNSAFESVDLIKSKLSKVGIKYKTLIVDNDNHHLYHAAAGFYTSGFDNAVCVIIDGFGSAREYPDAELAETTTLFYASDKFETLQKNFFYRPKAAKLSGWVGWSYEKTQSIEQTFQYPVTITTHLDIGKMYGTITRYIGFNTVEAGKTMGLSGYGKPNNLPPMFVDDTIISNSNLFRHDSQIDVQSYPVLASPNFQTKANLAYNVQKALEKIFTERVETALKIKYSNNIILGGGCALNILGNTIVKKHFPNLNVYVEPIGSDASQSIGAALYHYKLQFPDTKFSKTDNLYFGPHYRLPNIKQRLFDLVERYNNESSVPVNSNPQ